MLTEEEVRIRQAVRNHVNHLLMARAQLIESMCERSLLDPLQRGVMIDGDEVLLDERVPYGQIWDVTACGRDGVA